ncbi:DMT family transporter [Candidatus Parcubacteria bacterium]|nr:DMT family transporter [Candidatus Parcubacteria bacterium]
MPHYVGLTFAFIALISWGFGDFFIQQTTRVVGSWKALFFIGIVGLLGLFPFVKDDLASLNIHNILLLGVLGVIVVFAALFDFEALREGKIAIVEPILGLELPITVGLSLALANESLSRTQLVLIAFVFIGIILAITEHRTHLHYHKRIFEKGVILAGVGAIGMALTNFLVGVSSQSISPLITIWFAHSLLAVVCGIYLIYKKEFRNLISDVRNYPKPIIGQSILDNVAWVSFAKATTYIPISIATTITESYIALAVLLGLFVNREKLKTHQVIGITLAIIGVITLSYFS